MEAASVSPPTTKENKSPNYFENVLLIQSAKNKAINYETTIFEPVSMVHRSTTPIVVIMHGTNPFGDQMRERSIHATKFFVNLGWSVVLPMRRGYSHSGGQKVGLINCDLKNYGLENAADIAEVIDWPIHRRAGCYGLFKSS